MQPQLEDLIQQIQIVCGTGPDAGVLLGERLPPELAEPARTLVADLGLLSVRYCGLAENSLSPAITRAIVESDLGLTPGPLGPRLVVRNEAGAAALNQGGRDNDSNFAEIKGICFEADVLAGSRRAIVDLLQRQVREVIWIGSSFDSEDARSLAGCSELLSLRFARVGSAVSSPLPLDGKLRSLALEGQVAREVFEAQCLTELALLGHKLDAANIKALVLQGKLETLWVNGGHTLTDAQLKSLAKLPLREVVLSSERLKTKSGAALALAQSLEHVSLRDGAIDDTTVADLARLPKLQRLDLTNTGVTDGIAEAIGHMKMLVELKLDRTAIGPRSLAAATRLASLRRLSVADCQGISGNTDLHPGTALQWLDLTGCAVGDHVAKKLGSIAGLLRLSLASTKISAAGLEHLAALKGLVRLDVSRCALGDAAPLGKLIGLRALSAWDCKLGAETHTALGALTGLQELDLSKNPIGPQLGEALSRSVSLTRLRLDDVALGDDGLDQLSRVSRPLAQLGIAKNGLGAGTGTRCARFADLRLLQLSGNPLSDAGTEGLETLADLRTLFLDACSIGDSSAPRLQKLGRLRRLVVSGNRIGPDAMATLVDLPRLQWLDATGNPVPQGRFARAGLRLDL